MKLVQDTHANMATVYWKMRWEDWSDWRACQYGDDDHKELVDEVFAPIVQRYFENYWYWHIDDNLLH